MTRNEKAAHLFERVVSLLTAAAAVLVAIAVLRREFSAQDATPETQPEFLSNWRAIANRGIRVGRPDAQVTVLEFTDMECPFCKEFHQVLSRARNRFGDSLSYVFVHFPLEQHDNARRAAAAVECADRQGRFLQMVDAVFDAQRSLDTIRFDDVARRVGISDVSAFANCMTDSTTSARIEEGIALGNGARVTYTPNLLINGWRSRRNFNDSSFAEAVTNALRGKEPFERKRWFNRWRSG